MVKARRGGPSMNTLQRYFHSRDREDAAGVNGPTHYNQSYVPQIESTDNWSRTIFISIGVT
jgi:hypothetical protein